MGLGLWMCTVGVGGGVSVGDLSALEQIFVLNLA